MRIIEIVSLAQHVTFVDNKIHKHYTLGHRKTLIKTQFFVRTLLGLVHTYPDSFVSTNILLRLRLSSTRIRRKRTP